MEEMCVIEHSTLRYQPAAAVFSLPKAFAIWAIILFTTEIVGFTLEYCTSWGSIIMAGLVALIAVAIAARFLVQGTMQLWRRCYRNSNTTVLPM